MQTNKQYTEAIYDERLKTQTLEWMKQYDEHLTHACTFTMEQFDGNLTAKQAWEQWECFCKYLNRRLYKNAAKRNDKTLLILATLHGEISYEKLHIHAAISCIDKDYSFDELRIIIERSWREMKWAKHIGKVKEYRDAGWLGYMLRESTRLDLDSVNVGASCIPKTLQQ